MKTKETSYNKEFMDRMIFMHYQNDLNNPNRCPTKSLLAWSKRRNREYQMIRRLARGMGVSCEH